jgi:pimeloyl-ACP methyl ester carboxylesterase
MSEPVLPEATRRLTLQFDKDGEPTFATVCSPKSFRSRSIAVVPPRHVIPVIFVPGIMGTNLRATKASDAKQAPAWRPPNGKLAGIGEWIRRGDQEAVDRQKQMTPSVTEVDPTGKISMPRGIDTLTEEEARRRGWGELHWDSYGEVLPELEKALNDQYLNPGTKDYKEMDVWKLAQTLKKGKPGKEEDILKTWNPIKGEASALTKEEFTRLDDYYYPVWGCGYNWLESNEKSAQTLLKRIDEVLAWYDKTKYFIPEGKVIIVTHSMGGMVTRRAAQLAEGKILGVVNGVQPVGGAPVVYRRFRAGTEVGGWLDIPGAAAATIIGWSAAEITCVMANSPGPLELLPTKNYPPGWLYMERIANGQREALMPALPLADPYAEIYAKRVQDAWWGMIDETLIDPAKMHQENTTPLDSYKDSITQARDFHEKAGVYGHPNTYAHFGADHKQVSFGSVHWITHADIPNNVRDGLSGLPTERWTKFGKAQVGTENDGITFTLQDKTKPEKDDDPDAGDGTVPIHSGALIGEKAKHVFRMKGFNHAESYKDKDVIENVLYCLGKIIQGAIPAKDLPQNKGETCTVSGTQNDSSDSASQSSPASAS